MEKANIVVLVTAKDNEEAEKISQKLLENKLIACANIINDVKSKYWWQKKIDQSREVLLILKATKAQFSKIVSTVKEVHSYDVPEIIALPVIDGNPDYLRWIEESVRNE